MSEGLRSWSFAEGVPKLELGNERITRSEAPAWERSSRSSSFAGITSMRSRYRIFESEYPYFMTCTIVGWLPVFTRPEAAEIIFNCWRFHQRQSGLRLFGYVILENHLHLVADAPDLSAVMQSFKSFTAKQIIELLTQRGANTLLRQMRALKLRHKTESEYQVWQEGNHPQQIGSDEMMLQKLEYTHNNPVARGYVDEPVHWRWTSARNYAGLAGMIEVCTDWR